MNIRKSTIDDMSNVLALWYKNLDTLFQPFSGELRTELDAGNYFIAESDDGELIGFTTYKKMPRKKCLRISHFCINEKYRSQGCGRILLNHVKGFLNENYDVAAFPLQVECVGGAANNEFWLSNGTQVASRVLAKSGKTILTIQIGE